MALKNMLGMVRGCSLGTIGEEYVESAYVVAKHSA